MKYNKLPKTDLRLSQICLGTMMFGGQTEEAESLRIMDYAFEHGINFFDTANVYNQGESERIVGLGLKGRRSRIVLATKVGGQMVDDPNDAGLSRRNILAAVEASLRRLGTDYIDLYYLHFPDYGTAIEETLQAMTELVRSGKVRYVGISNYAAWQIADLLAACERYDWTPPVITQDVYNPITRGIESELVPFLRAHALGMAVYNPLAGGLLTGKHRRGPPAENTRFSNNKMYYDRYWSDENFSAVEKLEQIASGCGLSPVQLAMKWCAGQECVTSVISGVSRLSQAEQNIDSVEGEPLGEDVLAQCDEVWRSLSGGRFRYNR